MRYLHLSLLLLSASSSSFAQAPAQAVAAAATPITLDQAMAHPDWIGPPVEKAWWSWDAKQVFFDIKRVGSPLRDTYSQPIGGAAAVRVADAELPRIDAPSPTYDATHSRLLFIRNGDVFERDLRSGSLAQLTGSAEAESDPQYAADGRGVQFRIGNEWHAIKHAGGAISTIALPVAENDPNAPPPADAMRDMQLRLITTLKRQQEEREEKRLRAEQLRRQDAGRAAAPVYLGDEVQIDATSLSPGGRWLLVVTSPKGADIGRIGKLQRYVTESGYEETENQRTRVGRNLPIAQALKLVDLASGTVRDVSLDALPGIATDPLAAMRAARKLDPVKGNRAVRIEINRDNDGDDATPTVHWSNDGREVAVFVRAIDNKDRWIATVDFDAARLRAAHRLSDPGWINWEYNGFGWLPDSRTLWYLSEESGYSHLYTVVPGSGAAARALTQGQWEASAVRWSVDGNTAYFTCNRKWPGDYEVCAVARDGSGLREVTAFDGVESFELSPDGAQLLVRYSASYLPPQLAVLPAAGAPPVLLTDTRTAGFRARKWIEPQYVQVPSKHGAAPIWSKLYRPAQMEPGKKYPVVMFVHGAGYLQNVSARYPNYFREQMFHNLLVQEGYIVLDMDYRASQGYGRDWRTAIYRHMGKPELEDYLDGVEWMVGQQQGDRARVGIYGGSYGGFLTFMGLFRAPGTFVAGAALRPVSDWSTYNHEYTANILNTPELDPQAYLDSSPIEFAEGLRGHLLIAHGMIDDNVFYQDSVRLAQRLIELKKPGWELASYPLERHGFVQPESWYDEYRRIHELFERTLK